MSENKKETKNQDMIEKEMKEKMKQTVEDEKIPGSLEPEAVEKMLETRKKKKSNNRRWKYASVAAAACSKRNLQTKHQDERVCRCIV